MVMVVEEVSQDCVAKRSDGCPLNEAQKIDNLIDGSIL